MDEERYWPFPIVTPEAEWKQFTPINAEFFNEGVSGIGSPGGAAQVGAVAADHPTVAGWEAL